MCHCEVSDRCQRKSSKRYPCGRGRAPPLRTTRKSTAPHAKNLSLRSQCAHWLWQSVLPCGDNLFGAPHSLYRAGRTESSVPYGYTIGGVQWGGGLWSVRPTDGLVAGEGGPMWASAPTKEGLGADDSVRPSGLYRNSCNCAGRGARTPPHTPPPRKRTDAPQASVLPNSAKIICCYRPECPGPANP